MAGYTLAVGGANMDVSASADQALRPGDSTPGRVRHAPGGVARNVAENLARLGHPTRLISAVGDDPPGHAVLGATQRAGVDVSACHVLPGATTAVYVSVHDADGRVAVAVNDMQVLEQLTPAALQAHASAVLDATALVLDCNLSEAALGWLFAQRSSAPVFADAVSAFKCRRLLPWLGRVHTLKVNRLEAQALSGLPVTSEAEVEAAARWLNRQGVRHVVLSLGDEGLYHRASGAGGAADGGQTHEPGWQHQGWQSALPVAVRHASGAGDALMAGLVHSHLQGAAPSQAVRFASGCAALTLTVPAANHPGLCVAAVEALLNAHPAP